MFRGVNTVNLDSKGRLAIPTKYRDQLVRLCEGQMVVTVDRDGCLLLYPLPEWEEIERKLARLSSFQKQTRRLQRLLIGHATECEMDANGRILLSQPLREFAGLEKAVVLIGQSNKFEIWSETTWTERRKEWIEGDGEDEGDLPADLESLSL
ncbi:MAG: division/cell wall cluster transcriptional repressor MraZ [Acidiferrobacterales bacterium]|nr:division/cell wall cluster transcriptional repressor MraZ [Acidiferrobacterales bacterium]